MGRRRNVELRPFLDNGRQTLKVVFEQSFISTNSLVLDLSIIM